MNTRTKTLAPATLTGGICFATMILLMLIAYVPDFAPDAYIRLRRMGLIVAIPMIVATGVLVSVGLLIMESRGKNSQKGNSEDV